MRKSIIVLVAVNLSLVVLLTILGWQQNEAIKRGDLIVFWGGIDDRPGPIWVDKINREVWDKSSVFATVTYEDAEGKLWTRRDMICYRAYVPATYPSAPAEEALFRTYFPAWNEV